MRFICLLLLATTLVCGAEPVRKTYFAARDGITNSKLVFEKTGAGRIAYLGGSITTMEWPKLLSARIQARFPEAKLDFVKAIGETKEGEVSALNC